MSYDKPQVKLLERVEELRLLSSIADAGLLSSAEEAGLFSKLEAAGAFSSAEKLLPLADDLKLLSTAEYLLNVPANLLAIAGVALLAGEAGLITFVPDDNTVRGRVLPAQCTALPSRKHLLCTARMGVGVTVRANACARPPIAKAPVRASAHLRGCRASGCKHLLASHPWRQPSTHIPSHLATRLTRVVRASRQSVRPAVALTRLVPLAVGLAGAGWPAARDWPCRGR